MFQCISVNKHNFKKCVEKTKHFPKLEELSFAEIGVVELKKNGISSEVMILLHCPQKRPEDVDDEKRVTDLSIYENQHCLNKKLLHLELPPWHKIM